MNLCGKCDNELASDLHALVIGCKILNTDFDSGYGVGFKCFESNESHIEILYREGIKNDRRLLSRMWPFTNAGQIMQLL